MHKTSQDSKNLFILAFISSISFENKNFDFLWYDFLIGYYNDWHTFYNHQNFMANANWAYFNRTHLFQKFTLEIDHQVMRTLIPICEHFKLNVLHHFINSTKIGAATVVPPHQIRHVLNFNTLQKPKSLLFNIRGFEIFWNFVRWWDKESSVDYRPHLKNYELHITHTRIGPERVTAVRWTFVIYSRFFDFCVKNIQNHASAKCQKRSYLVMIWS